MTSVYRSDIDGLRGVAVLAVVLFHFGCPGVTGGYVGVDVFFVVSGYLITSIILKEIQGHEFSIARFYERRIRRIFPALFATVALTLAGSAVLFIPDNFKSLGESTVAVVLFVSNFLFWNQTGYFDEPATHKPLLHTWSLSVEEQFYVFYPLLLVAAWRFLGSRTAYFLAVLAGLSFALSVYGVAHNPSATFYWTPTRGWELLLGALLVYGDSPSAPLPVRNALAVLGLTSIVASVFVFDAETPFPGLAALLPTAGTALILHTGSGPGTIVSRILGTKYLVGVGLISYSLYLLHWPLLVLGQHLAIIDLTTAQKTVLLLVTFALSLAAWRWVEQPFRSKQRLSRQQVFVCGGIGMTVLGAVGLLVMLESGFPERFETPPEPDWRACNFRLPHRAPGLCTLGSGGEDASFLLWGDSHAGAFKTAVGESASRESRSGYLAYGSGCPALLMEGPANTTLQFGPNSHRCRQFNDEILAYVAAHGELTTIILVARWVQYGEQGPDVAEFEPALRRMVSTLSGLDRSVVIVNQVPEVGYQVPEAYRIALLTGRDLNEIIAPSRQEYTRTNHRVLAAFEALRRDGATLVDVRDRMCGLTRCQVVDSGHPLYADDNHLSDYGSHYLSSMFDLILAKPLGHL